MRKDYTGKTFLMSLSYGKQAERLVVDQDMGAPGWQKDSQVVI